MHTTNNNKLVCGNKTPTRCNRWFLLQILLLAQHVSDTIMPIIRSSSVLYKWLLPVVFDAWFSSCRYGEVLRVVCLVCGLLRYLYNTLELLMMGIMVPETCWASNKNTNIFVSYCDSIEQSTFFPLSTLAQSETFLIFIRRSQVLVSAGTPTTLRSFVVFLSPFRPSVGISPQLRLQPPPFPLFQFILLLYSFHSTLCLTVWVTGTWMDDKLTIKQIKFSFRNSQYGRP